MATRRSILACRLPIARQDRQKTFLLKNNLLTHFSLKLLCLLYNETFFYHTNNNKINGFQGKYNYFSF